MRKIHNSTKIVYFNIPFSVIDRMVRKIHKIRIDKMNNAIIHSEIIDIYRYTWQLKKNVFTNIYNTFI